jgi:hypothetical protein
MATREVNYWPEPKASDTRVLNTFRDGYGRIGAVAERKLLGHPAAHLEMTPDDFARP